jgi:hypothetical protein
LGRDHLNLELGSNHLMADTKKDRPTYATDYVKGDWDKAVFLDNPHTDNLMSAMLNLGAEFWAMRRRQMVVEKLLDQKGTIDRATIEAYNPSEEERVAWTAERDDFIERTFSVLTRVGERVGGNMPSAKVPPLNKG